MCKSKKLMRKTCCFAKNIVRKTQELFEISQLNLKMMQIKNKIERKLVIVGYYIYDNRKKEGFYEPKRENENEKLKLIFNEIDELYKKLDFLKREADELKSYVKKNEICMTNCKKKQDDLKKEEVEYNPEYKNETDYKRPDYKNYDYEY